MAPVGDFVRVSLRDPSAEELASVQRELDLPGTVIQQLGAVARRPSLEVVGERLVAVIKTVGWDAAEEETRSGEVQLVLGEDLVVICLGLYRGFSAAAGCSRLAETGGSSAWAWSEPRPPCPGPPGWS